MVSSPEFTKTLPAGIREKYRPEESLLRCTLIEERTTCSEGKIGTASGKRGVKHSLCEDGWQNSHNSEHSYEEVFGLNEGDDVIGPVEAVTETSSEVQVKGKGVFEVKPEFDLTMAVYGTNKFMYLVRTGMKDHVKRGPCIHHCVSGQIKTLKLSNDPLIFNLKK